jgi:hypothetical protein
MRFLAVFPDAIKAITYKRNSLFVETEDWNGNSHRAKGTGVMLYRCRNGCRFLLFSNHGLLTCPLCRTYGATGMWVKPQLAFIPDKPSDLEWSTTPPKRGDKKGEKK